MRQIIPIPERKLYSDEGFIQQAIEVARGQLISGTAINQAEISTMVDGEKRIDKVNQREVVKFDGKLYKQVVIDNEVKLQEL